MARTTVRASYSNLETTRERVEAVLRSNGYSNINENGESVWKNGNGFMTAMKYIKIEFADSSTLLISGWIRAMAGSEMKLDGFVGALPKKQVMKVIKAIQSAVV